MAHNILLDGKSVEVIDSYRRSDKVSDKLGVAFDAFSAVETASEMSLNLLLNPQRMSRLIAHKSLNKNQLGWSEQQIIYWIKGLRKSEF